MLPEEKPILNCIDNMLCCPKCDEPLDIGLDINDKVALVCKKCMEGFSQFRFGSFKWEYKLQLDYITKSEKKEKRMNNTVIDSFCKKCNGKEVLTFNIKDKIIEFLCPKCNTYSTEVVLNDNKFKVIVKLVKK